MTVISIGYEGTIVPNVAWAEMQDVLAAKYMVFGPGAAVVSPVVGGTRQVEISTGVIGGRGIRDDITAPEIVQLTEVLSGVEYFLIVARRTWQTTQATSFTHISGGTSQPSSLPARTVDPGVTDDQPLALVSLAAGETEPKVVYDLRCVGGPNTFHVDPAVPQTYLSYLISHVTTTVHQGIVTRTRKVDPDTGNTYWQVDPEVFDQPDVTIFTGDNWQVDSGNTIGTISDDGREIQAWIDMRRSVNNFTPGANGDGNNTKICQLQPLFRPPHDTVIPFRYIAPLGGRFGGFLNVTAGTGNVFILSIVPNTEIGAQPPGEACVFAHLKFTKTGN